MPKLSVELGLPLLRIGVADIKLTRGRRRSGAKGVGPFLIVSRQCGLALDTAYGMENGSPVWMWAVHGKLQQFWSLRPAGKDGEFSVRAEMGGLALDATTDERGADAPFLWTPHGAPWQRWRLSDTPDGVGLFIQSVYSGAYLTMNAAGENGWIPWLSTGLDDRDSMDKQWLLVRVYGSDDRYELRSAS